jgi:Protein of unknown function (DUF3662)/Inner membrane component of T3SS, cytoplasmic domain
MVLRSLEQKLESLFEGVFGRAFRTNVQPVELARKLAKEMDEHRVVSVSRVYVPNEYTVYLSTDDRKQFEGYENSLLSELEEYVGEHARRESYALLTPPRVSLETDSDLALGEFGIGTRMVQPHHGNRNEADEAVVVGATMIYKHEDADGEAAEAPPEEPLPAGEAAFLSWNGKRMRVEKRSIVLGRSRECDIQVEDSNVSRRHAELRREGADYWVVDLDSTNGLEVNGKRVKRAKLDPGDSFTVGSTEVTFSTEQE